MVDGIYICKYDDEISHGQFWIAFKETKSSYIMELIKNTVRYTPGYIEMLFKNNNRAVIKKQGSQHAMRIWSDKEFTIYPFRGGKPFYFEWDSGINKHLWASGIN